MVDFSTLYVLRMMRRLHWPAFLFNLAISAAAATTFSLEGTVLSLVVMIKKVGKI